MLPLAETWRQPVAWRWLLVVGRRSHAFVTCHSETPSAPLVHPLRSIYLALSTWQGFKAVYGPEMSARGTAEGADMYVPIVGSHSCNTSSRLDRYLMTLLYLHVIHQ